MPIRQGPRANLEHRTSPAVLVLVVLLVGSSTSFTSGHLSGGTSSTTAPTTTSVVTSALASAIPYANLSVSLANKLHEYLMNQSSEAFYYSASSNWQSVTTAQYSTLGNAFIVAGLLQLYQATDNQTYLLWASTTSDQYWNHAWAAGVGGFYDTYDPNWLNSTCVQVAQDNAMFELDFLDLYRLNGSSQWLQRANAEEQLLNDRFWNSTYNIVEISYDPCTGLQSGDVSIEISIGSYLWATGQWTSVSGNSTYLPRMNDVASFARLYLWDGASNDLKGGPDSTDCGGQSGSLGFMRTVYANLTGLEDCRKGANENIWGAMGIAQLYSLTGNTTLLAWTDQDLAWINNTLWDSQYGGYHNDVFRNDTLRSSCSSTNDPRDYPGWTEGEQPMFWWNIGVLTNNATMMKWSMVVEQWTAEHQWNYTQGNGGDMTCLNDNTLPDKGSPDLYDWVQGSALYSFSTIGPLETQTSRTSTHSSVSSLSTSTYSSASLSSTSTQSSTSLSSTSTHPSTSRSSTSVSSESTSASTSTPSSAPSTSTVSSTQPPLINESERTTGLSQLPTVSSASVALAISLLVLALATIFLLYRARTRKGTSQLPSRGNAILDPLPDLQGAIGRRDEEEAWGPSVCGVKDTLVIELQ